MRRVLEAAARAVAFLLVLSSTLEAQGRVQAVSGGKVTLSLGARDGLEVGMTGQVRKTESAGDKLQTLQIATFRLTQVQERTSTAELTQVGAGFRVEAGNEVVFDRPPRPRREAPASPTGTDRSSESETPVRRPEIAEEKPSARATPTAAPAADDQAQTMVEIAFWNSIATGADPKEFEAYLAKYPGGQFAELARARLERLRPTGTGSSQPPGPSSAGALDAQGLDARALYSQAYADYARGNYRRAFGGFVDYVLRYPHTDFTDNAQYWIGECLYGEKMYTPAIEAWDTLLSKYPSSDKLPDVLLKKGMALDKLGRKTQALVEYRHVVNRFPDSKAAVLARERLRP